MPNPDVTPEIVGAFERRPTLRIAFGLIAFLVVANAVASLLLAWRPVNLGSWLVRAKWDLLDRTPPVETLVLGDSSCNQGVRPEVLDSKLGTKSLNLCTIGTLLAVNDAWMLEEYIARHGAPKRVVIVHVYDMWTRTNTSFVRLVAKIPRPWGFWKRLEPPLDLGVSDLEDILSSRYIPLHSEILSLQQWISSPGTVIKTRFAIDDRGFMAVADAMPKRVAQDVVRHARELAALPPEPTRMNDLALLALDDLARKHGITMTIALAPMVEDLWAVPAIRHHVDGLQIAIRRILGPRSPIRILDGPPATFTADQMENVDHVVGNAARRYTEWLAERVR